LTGFVFRRRTLTLLIILSFFLLVIFVGTSGILPAQNIDSGHIMNYLETQEYLYVWNSYTATSYLFSLVPYNLLYPIVIIIGGGALTLFIRPLRSRTQVLLASFITIAPVLLILTRPVKDTIVILLSIAILFLIRSRVATVFKICIIMALYLLYAHFVRQYFYLCAIVFLVIWIFINSRRKVKVVMLFVGVSIFFAIPGNIFTELQGSRDIYNFYRIGSGEIGSRTAFCNFLPPTNGFNFLVNYVVAAIRLNFSFLFYPGIRELFLTLNVIIYAFLINRGMNAENVVVRLAATLLLAHISVLWLFEPDLGSYLRHLSSIFLYLTPIMSSVSVRKKRINRNLVRENEE